MLIRRHGAGSFWLVAAAGHVGSTVVTYTGVGLLWLAHARLVDRLLDQPDYGISCVWAGALGALVGDEVARAGRTRRVLVAALATAALAALSAVSSGVALPEHVVAFVLGALAVRLSPAPRRALLPQLRA